MVNLAIIGYGYWGPNLVRNFYNTKNCKVALVVDSRQDRLDLVKAQFPTIGTSTNFEDAINSNEIDAIVIATPTAAHYRLAKAALQNGKHVLVEKPMAKSVIEAEDIIATALSNNKILMVDHTFLYTGAVKKMKQLITNGDLGDISYFDSTRINLGLFQPDINVLWDLAPHDISILFHLIQERPVSVSARGISHTPNGLENIAYLTVNYESLKIAHFSCSWSSPVKIRKILIGGTKKMILFDDVEPTEKLKVYDTGYTVKNDEDKHKLLVDYRVGDIYIPKLAQSEALSGMAADFINAIITNTTPISNYQIGLEVVKVLAAAQESINNKGVEIKINY